MTAPRAVLLAAILIAACSHAAAPAPTADVPRTIEVLGTGPGISMARVVLGPGQSVALHAGPCQDVSVLVENGAIHASGDDAPSLAEGQAARFSATTTLHGSSEQGAHLFAAATLSNATGRDSVDWNRAPDNDACPQATTPWRLSDPNHIGPFMHAGGRLAVSIYLDDAGSSRPVASLGTLDGDPRLSVPEHTHETSAEVLWFQDGSGTMRVGDEMRPIRPGTFVYVPPGTIHGFEPDGRRPVFAYQVYTPSGPEQRFRTPRP